MENQITDLLLNLSYHIMQNMEGGNSMQIFTLINLGWLIIFFLVCRKYNNLLERAVTLAQKQDEILDHVSQWLDTLEHKQEVYKLESEIIELKQQLRIQREVFKKLKK